MPQATWLEELRASSLLRRPPLDKQQREVEVLTYVELLARSASDIFAKNLDELIRTQYPEAEDTLLQHVLARFILHHPEHASTVLHPISACISNGAITYSKKNPPFASLISLFVRGGDPNEPQSGPWDLACGEVLKVLTHYNQPVDSNKRRGREPTGRNSGGEGGGDGGQLCRGHFPSNNDIAGGSTGKRQLQSAEKQSPTLTLTPWLTDCLLAAPISIRNNYFRWCGGVTGRYVIGEEMQPPTKKSAVGSGNGKKQHVLSATPRWPVGNGASMILSVCEDEYTRYGTVELTAVAAPALLLPPPVADIDECVAWLPPFASLFHRYYALAAPGVTQQLLCGLLNASASWAPNGVPLAVQLVKLLRATEDYSCPSQLPPSWLCVHFLKPIGASMAKQAGTASDAAAALLFRLFTQPALLFPPPSHAHAGRLQSSLNDGKSSAARGTHQVTTASAIAHEDATARGVAELMSGNGRKVEWRICALWEAAYGLLPLDNPAVALAGMLFDSPPQRPSLSWLVFRPLLQVFKYLPRGSPSQACMRRIFSETVRAILDRTFPVDVNEGMDLDGQENGTRGAPPADKGIPVCGNGANGSSGVRVVSVEEVQLMLHCLCTDACLSSDLSAQLLSDMLAASLSHDALSRKSHPACAAGTGKEQLGQGTCGSHGRRDRDRGAVAAIHSYITAALCELACNVQLTSSIVKLKHFQRMSATGVGMATTSSTIQQTEARHQGKESDAGAQGHGTTSAKISSGDVPASVSTMCQQEVTHRILFLLERLLMQTLPNRGDGITAESPNEIVTATVVAAHVSELLHGSRTCMNALVTIMRSCADPAVSACTVSVIKLVEQNSRTVEAAAIMSRESNVKVKEEALKDLPPLRDEEAMMEDCSKQTDQESCGIDNKVKSDCPTLMDMVEGDSASWDGEGKVQCRVHEENNRNMDIDMDADKRNIDLNVQKGHKQAQLAEHEDNVLPPSKKYQWRRVFPLDASDMVGFLCHDQTNGAARNAEEAAAGFNGADNSSNSSNSLLIILLREKQTLALAAIPLLWHHLITVPMVPISSNGTVAKFGWHQVAQALCNIVAASPQKAAVAIVAQVEADLRPWSGIDDLSSQEDRGPESLAGAGAASVSATAGASGGNNRTLNESSASIVNMRIVSFLTKLLRLQNVTDAVLVIAEARELLSRATDGLSAATEASALPQLELLDAALTAVSMAHTIGGKIGGRVSTALLRLMKDRLPSVVRCLSVQSSHVRATSISLLRRLAHTDFWKNVGREVEVGSEKGNSYYERVHGASSHMHLSSSPPPGGVTRDAESASRAGKRESVNWSSATQECVRWETHYRRAGSLSISLLADAAAALGCQVFI